MELIDNCKNSFTALLDYFTCNLRPVGSEQYSIVDWTKQQWKYRKEGKSWCYVSRLQEDGTWSNETLFHIRRTTTELYRTKEFTLFAWAWTNNYNRYFQYYILDNSKLIEDGGNS